MFQGPCLQANCSILLTDHTQSDCLPERVRDYPVRTAQKAGIVKQRSFFPATTENRKACVQLLINTVSVSWQDLLMSCRVLQLKLSQEASLRRECLLASSKQSRPEKLLLPTKHALLYSFPSFLRVSVDSVIPTLGAICNMRAGLLGFLSSPVPQQPASNKENHTQDSIRL